MRSEFTQTALCNLVVTVTIRRVVCRESCGGSAAQPCDVDHPRIVRDQGIRSVSPACQNSDPQMPNGQASKPTGGHSSVDAAFFGYLNNVCMIDRGSLALGNIPPLLSSSRCRLAWGPACQQRNPERHTAYNKQCMHPYIP
jgi:hypothetical protein